MILFLAFLAGFAFGWRRAGLRGGVTADKVQYGFAHGFAAVILVAVAALLLGFMGASPF